MTIVGGSAAGFYTAYLLAREGAAVRVIERAEQLAPTPRTLIVTRRMRDLLGATADASIVNEIRRFELFTDGRAASITLRHPDLVIERSALIRRLAHLAQSEGAQLTFGRQFQGLQPSGDKLSLELCRVADGQHEEWTAETVIGADGGVSRVARSAGWPRLKTAALVQAIVPLPEDMSPHTVRVWFVPQDTPYFYWLIPESRTRGALGLIGTAGEKTRMLLEHFLEKHKLEPLAFQGARIPVYRRWVPVRRRVGSASVYLVGDAAAQVKVTTIGGIVTGLRGARGIADSILKGRTSAELRSLRKELDLHLLLRRSLHNFQQADYSRLVDLLNASAQRSLGEYSRDDALKVIWRICLSQPRLVLMGLRGLLASGRVSRGEEIEEQGASPYSF